jgi:hypothetical protein
MHWRLLYFGMWRRVFSLTAIPLLLASPKHWHLPTKLHSVVHIYHTIRHHILEDSNLHFREILKSYILCSINMKFMKYMPIPIWRVVSTCPPKVSPPKLPKVFRRNLILGNINWKFYSIIFCNMMTFSRVEVHRRFGGMCCLHLQGWKLSQTKNQQEAGSKQREPGEQKLVQGKARKGAHRTNSSNNKSN